MLAALMGIPCAALADNVAWAEYDSATTTLTFKYADESTKPDGAFVLNAISSYGSDGMPKSAAPDWAKNNGMVTKVVFDESFADARPETCASWFALCSKLTDIEGLANLNTSEVRDMFCMFSGCSSLKKLDLSGLNTANVLSMKQMFMSCGALADLNVSGFDTKNVITFQGAFQNCAALTELDLSSFETPNATSMQTMFNGCEALTKLDISRLNTESVTKMKSMFNGCKAIKTLELKNFNTAEVTDFSNMFLNCTALESVDLSSFNTAEATTFASMFNGCAALKALDLSSFDTAKATNFSSMFNGCAALVTIYVSDSFSTAKATNSKNMFGSCSSIEGAVSFDSNKVDATMANYTDGYFTKAPSTAISAPAADAFSADAEYYDLMGRKIIGKPGKGMVIVRKGGVSRLTIVK